MWKIIILTGIIFMVLIDITMAFSGSSNSYSSRFQISQFSLDNETRGYSSNPSNIDDLIKFRFGVLGFDVIAPNLILIQPENKTYYGSVLDLKFSTDSSKDTIWYNLDNQENITLTENIQFSNSLGDHILNLYANDSSNNINSSSVSYNIGTTSDTSGGGGSGGNLGTGFVKEVSFNITLNSTWIKGQTESIKIISKDIDIEDINLSFYYANISFGGFQLINKTSLNETFIFNYNVPEIISSGRYRLYINIKNKEELFMIDVKNKEEAKKINIIWIISIIFIILAVLSGIGYFMYEEEIKEYVKKRKSKEENKSLSIRNQ
ncbi:MAG: hypothetical protein AABY22_03635 [Nanoarchaeota archaeon]